MQPAYYMLAFIGVMMKLPLDTTSARIVQMMPATAKWAAIFDTSSFGAQDYPFAGRMPLVYWVLIDDGHEQTIEGIVVDDTRQLNFAENCKGFLGYGHPGDDNRWSHKIDWVNKGNEYRAQKENEPALP